MTNRKPVRDRLGALEWRSMVISHGSFSKAAAMRILPGPVNRSLPVRCIMYPSPVNGHCVRRG